MNVEIFCERGVRWGAGTFVRAQGAWGIVLGAFAGASGVRWEEGAFARAQGRGAMFLGRSQGQETRV